MGAAIQIDKELYQEAKRQSNVQHRSAAKQVEHWAKIGRIAEENPDLSYNSIKSILFGLEDYRTGNVEPYDPNKL
jgi:hypothetical protein